MIVSAHSLETGEVQNRFQIMCHNITEKLRSLIPTITVDSDQGTTTLGPYAWTLADQLLLVGSINYDTGLAELSPATASQDSGWPTSTTKHSAELDGPAITLNRCEHIDTSL